MGADLPKQFLSLAGRPILMRTIEKFAEFDPQIEIILVLNKDHQDAWKELCRKYHFQIGHRIAEGGAERYHSIKNGLALASGEVIGVHDGVRPLVSEEVIKNCFETAANKGTAVPVIPIKESIRKIENGSSKAVKRKDFRIVQTPQCFKRDILLKAYEQEFDPSFTDDASLVERAGNEIVLVKGNDENIKITTPSDLLTAEALL